MVGVDLGLRKLVREGGVLVHWCAFEKWEYRAQVRSIVL